MIDVLQEFTPYQELARAHVDAVGGGQRILDLGAGTGHITKQLLKKKKQVRAVDFNDAMLQRLRTSCNGYPGLTFDEARTHLSMWAMMAAPLIAGNDPTAMTGQDHQVLTASDVLAVDQDPLGRAATRIVDGDRQVWAKPLLDGTAVALYNRGDTPATITTTPDRVGLPPGLRG